MYNMARHLDDARGMLGAAPLVRAPSMSSKLSREEALRRFRARFHVPLEWRDVLGPAGDAKVLSRAMTRSQLHHIIWQLLVDKQSADTKCRSLGTPLDTMPEFVANNLLFKFGTRALTQARLSSLIGSTSMAFETDRLPYFFARFCGLAVRFLVVCVGGCMDAEGGG